MQKYAHIASFTFFNPHECSLASLNINRDAIIDQYSVYKKKRKRIYDTIIITFCLFQHKIHIYPYTKILLIIFYNIILFKTHEIILYFANFSNNCLVPALLKRTVAFVFSPSPSSISIVPIPKR